MFEQAAGVGAAACVVSRSIDLLGGFCSSLARDAAEDDDVGVGIAAQSVRAVRHARHFTRSPEPRDRIAVAVECLGLSVDAHAAHRVVHARDSLDHVVLALAHVDQAAAMMKVLVVALAGHRRDALHGRGECVIRDLREVGDALEVVTLLHV